MRALRPVALLLLAGCSSSTAPLPRDGAPDAFEVTYSGYGYGSHVVTLRGEALVVVRRQFFDPRVGVDSVTVVPDGAAWRAFWSAARTAGIARWPRTCADPRVADGGGFALRIVAGGETWERSGENAYPTARGGCTREAGPSPEYETFTAAVAALIGRPFP
ncbi:hypothetical protein [Roseisolibacter sp. H3M3-2]|uniref:hypothetical protein n=1 Tax=Roseisolibacter sp. H3M3-2 TaxID=3031323 RepID=UPI0023DA612A|nr:hypothetical protein [Roseisolibacter sp. H3M3-2]MDF1505370.1 hypothetical protein [Roseisolibacter sp. H3M3-2]